MKNISQSFEEESLKKWVGCFKEIVIIITSLHVLKYPTAMIKYDYSKKFGIDIPSFSHFREHELESFEKLLSKNEYDFLRTECIKHPDVIDFLYYVENLPEMTNDDVDKQIMALDKYSIEAIGYERYLEKEIATSKVLGSSDFHPRQKIRHKKLKSWAKKNNFLSNGRLDGPVEA
jgi:hypothetical protein